MGLGKTNKNEVFTYHENLLKKITTKKLALQQMTISIRLYARVLAESLMHFQECLFFLAINR